MNDHSLRKVRPFFLIVAVYLAVVIVFGGGGWPSPGPELVVELAALIVAVFSLRWVREGFAVWDRGLIVLCASFCAIPLLQLIPLPAEYWTSLPGREPIIVVLAAADATGKWMPISMAPDRTLAGGLALIPPLVMLGAIRILPPVWRTGLLVILVGMGLLAAAIGTVQVMSGGAVAHFYPTMEGYAVGFQANRNSAADLYLIALCALVALTVRFPAHLVPFSRRAACAAIAALLALAVVMTGSRTGVLLLIVPTCMAILLLSYRSRKQFAGLIIGLSLAVPAVVALASSVPMIDRTLSRFALNDGGRFAMWDDALFQIGQTFPFGSGIGTGSAMLVAAEPLDRLDPSVPNRVHNDYLEWILEAGLPGAILLLISFIFVIRRGLIGYNQRDGDRPGRAEVAFALSTITVIAVHSIVDYPVRSLAIACMLAMAVAFLPPSSALGVTGRDKFGGDDA